MLILASIMVGIVVVGLGANYYAGDFKQSDPKEGASVHNVLVATELLAGLLLAIVITDVSASYASTRDGVKEEAGVVDTLYESTEYVDMPFRQDLQGDIVCYARAVVGPEWTALAKGKSSPVPSNYTGTKPHAIRATLLAMTPDATGFDLVQSADAERGDLRSARVLQANPKEPPAVIWFTVLLVALSLGGLAFSIPRADNRGQLVALIAVTITFISAVGLIYNLDRPFSGALALKSTAMQTTADDDGADYRDAYGISPPCDAEGNPRNNAGGAAAPATTTTTPKAGPTTTAR